MLPVYVQPTLCKSIALLHVACFDDHDPHDNM